MSELEQHTIHKPFSSPKEAEDDGIFGLPELVTGGYDFKGDESVKLSQFHQEYGKNDRIMFFIKDSGLAVASLVLDPKPDILGKKVLGVGGIVVKSEYRGKGLASNLFIHAVETLKPEVIVGNTKSPALVLTWPRSLSECGFVTCFGQFNVTENQKLETSNTLLAFLNGYMKLKSVIYDQDYVHIVSTDILNPDVPDISGFSDAIKTAFEPIIKKQYELGNVSTAVMPLISVQGSLLQKGADIHDN